MCPKFLINISGGPRIEVGGAKMFSGIVTNGAKWSHANKVSFKMVWGPGPALGPWKLLGFSLLNMHSPCFLGTFL